MHVHSREKLKRLEILRKKGHSIQEIMNILSMPKTTVWHHVQQIPLPGHILRVIQKKQKGSRNRSDLDWKEAYYEGCEYITGLNALSKMLIAVCLYWGEGTKKDFSLSNTDPDLIKVFVDCLEVFGIPKERLSIHIRLYEDLDQQKAIAFWAKIIGIPKSQIKSVNILSGKKKGKLLYGMCRLRVMKAGYYLKLFRVMQKIIFEQITRPRSSMDRAPHS